MTSHALRSILLIATACSACGTGPSDPGNQLRIVQLSTHGLGSILNSVGTGIATVLSENLDVEVRALATSGPTEWMPLMASGGTEFGVLSVWDAQAAWKGQSVYESLSGGKGFDIALVASGEPSLAGVIVPESSGIRSVQELRGKRVVAEYTGSPGLTAEAQALLANHGLTADDVTVISMPGVNAGVRAVLEGRADASAAASVGMGIVSELDAVKGARFLPSDPAPDALERVQEIFPATLVKVSPGPDKTGVREEMYMMSFDFYLVSRRDLPEGLVYRVLEALWDRNETLVKVNHQLSGWTKEVFVNPEMKIPCHPEAVRFYREKNVWTEAAESTQRRLEGE